MSDMIIVRTQVQAANALVDEIEANCENFLSDYTVRYRLGDLFYALGGRRDIAHDERLSASLLIAYGLALIVRARWAQP